MRKVFTKYASKCANCGCELGVGTPGYFQIVTRKMYCLSCGDAEPNVETAKPPPQNAVVEPSRNERAEAIAKAHQENMVANEQLVTQISALRKAIDDHRTEVKNLCFELKAWKGGR